MKVTLEGKMVLVTGAASGIGAAIAKEAANAAPAGLMLTDRDGEGLAKIAATSDASSIMADLTEPDAAKKLVDATINQFGRIDCLVNSAGLTDRGSLIDAELALWEKLFAVNTRAPFFLMQKAVLAMLKQASGGAIVNILSMNAHCGAADLAVYSATKAALSTLTKNAANAHLSDRIRVNGINVGWVATESEHRMQSEVLGKGDDWEKEVSSRLPLGRMLMVDEVARHAIFQLSDASAPMSGVCTDLEQKVVGA